MSLQQKKVKDAALGDICHGFVLTKKEYITDIDATLFFLRHEKTEAELIYSQREDTNKTFSIGFTTLPEDSTGVFHILEHSVLNGSKKYPVKEPFVSMLQSSLQTFLNAMTFPDKTVYPVASRNEEDFFNLMSVYLDAVFCPKIYTRPEIFMQEGWHYELESPDATPTYNGVVFSEMKGALAEAESVMEEEEMALLFPDTSYGFVSGGHPACITDLTYEQFIAAHQRFYHPTNAKIVLDGDLDIDRALAFIDEEYLSHYTHRENDFAFTAQEARTAEKTITFEAREGETLSHMSVSKILCAFDEIEKTYAAKVLADYLTGSNEAPLKRAFLEKGLGQDAFLSVNDGIYQPYLSFVVRNTEVASFAKIKEQLSLFANEHSKNGLDKKALSASLERFAFHNKELESHVGLTLSLKMYDSWLYGGNPTAHIDNAHIFESLRQRVNEGYFEALLVEMLGNKDDKCYLYANPSVTKGEENERSEKEKCAAAARNWTKEERESVYASFCRMTEWQQSEDTPELLATLPTLNIADIPEKISTPPTTEKTLSGRRVLEVSNKTNGIVYLNLFFDISDLSLEELRMLTILTEGVGALSTLHYSAAELQTEIKATLGGISADLSYISKTSDTRNTTPYLLVSVKMLEENAEKGMALIKEILLNGRYDETDKIHEMLLQSEYFLKQSMIGSGHTLAVTKALAPFTKEGYFKEMLEGESYINWFSSFLQDFSENAASISLALDGVKQKTFAQNRLFVGYSGLLREDTLADFIAGLPSASIGGVTEFAALAAGKCAIEIPAGVGFSAVGQNLYALGAEYSGEWVVLSSMMTYSYLWNAVRVKGGAYGTGMSVRPNGDVFCYSYRDPNLKNTATVFKGMADFLADTLAKGIQLDDIIIGAVNKTDPLLSAGGVCLLACSRYLKGMDEEAASKTRKEILRTTPEGLKRLLPLLRRLEEESNLCAVGDKSAIAFAK